MTGKVGVAISTTGTRPEMLERAVQAWTLEGVDVVQVHTDTFRHGVAWNKNRGILDLMNADVQHLFLADDDVYPLHRGSWEAYVQDPEPHLMLCWGKHRLLWRDQGYAEYKWPRGPLLYAHRSVVEAVGGMRTEFGAGGHEHVEWSRRIHQAGLTSRMFADLDRDPREWWHAEDMPLARETVRQFQARKRRNTTIKRTTADRRRVDGLWAELDGNTDYVDYR